MTRAFIHVWDNLTRLMLSMTFLLVVVTPVCRCHIPFFVSPHVPPIGYRLQSGFLHNRWSLSQLVFTRFSAWESIRTKSELSAVLHINSVKMNRGQRWAALFHSVRCYVTDSHFCFICCDWVFFCSYSRNIWYITRENFHTYTLNWHISVRLHFSIWRKPQTPPMMRTSANKLRCESILGLIFYKQRHCFALKIERSSSDPLMIIMWGPCGLITLIIHENCNEHIQGSGTSPICAPLSVD